MKYVFIWIISFYQLCVSPLLKNMLGIKSMCRYPETCSMYAKRMILEKGLIKGGALAFLRLSSCHPFGKIDK